MDKQSTIGFVLIGLVLIGWMWLQAPPPQQHTVQRSDTTQTAVAVPRDTVKREEPGNVPAVAREGRQDGTGRFFAGRETGRDLVMTIVTELYTAEVSSRGAAAYMDPAQLQELEWCSGAAGGRRSRWGFKPVVHIT